MIESLIAMARFLSPRQDDDSVDRLHCLYTPNILLVFAVLLSFKQFGGHPQECMFPNRFPKTWEQYADNYCYAQDTYYVDPEQHVILISEDKRYTSERHLSYYKWIPFFLLLQAALFQLPSIFWRYLSFSSGIRLHEIIEKAMDPGNLEEPNKTQNIAVLSNHLENALKFHRRTLNRKIEVHKKLKCLNMPYTAFFISVMYLITKALYLLNAGLQLYLLNRFLKTDKGYWYGVEIIEGLLKGVEWQESGVFPRESICDFQIRSMGNIQRYSVQCVLVINLFNEKIFLLLWFWYAFLIGCTILSFAYWFITITVPVFGRWFISQSLELSEWKFDPASRAKEVERFVTTYLRHDGVFVLRMVTTHAGVIFGTDLVLSLWNSFNNIEEELQDQDNGSKRKKLCEELTDACLLRRRKKEKNEEDLLLNLDPSAPLLPEKSKEIEKDRKR